MCSHEILPTSHKGRMFKENVWKLPIRDIGCHQRDVRHTSHCHVGTLAVVTGRKKYWKL